MMYIVLIGLGLFLLFILLTDLGPQHSVKPFWRHLQRARDIMDKIFSVIFLIGTIAATAVTLVAGVSNWLNGGGTSYLVTGAVFLLIVAVCFFSIRSNRASIRRGEMCECCGDCAKCKIQCTSNEKYYGTRRGK